ncbi:MAG: hypothetical protein ACPHRO_01460 [Nannocystaceae bacterium]
MQLVAERLAQGLQAFTGYRTLWIGPKGSFTHAEPEEELEAAGYRYVATLHRPSVDELLECLLRVIPVEPIYRLEFSQAIGPESTLSPVG